MLIEGHRQAYPREESGELEGDEEVLEGGAESRIRAEAVVFDGEQFLDGEILAFLRDDTGEKLAEQVAEGTNFDFFEALVEAGRVSGGCAKIAEEAITLGVPEDVVGIKIAVVDVAGVKLSGGAGNADSHCQCNVERKMTVLRVDVLGAGFEVRRGGQAMEFVINQ